MQVDSTNFEEHIDLILKEIQTAHFVAFDCEFTGLVTQLESIEGVYPDHREFYERIKETALNFSLLQLGITLFHYEAGEYYPKAYNFLVSANQRPNFNKVFLSEWESMAFLVKNGMNFGQVFLNGIDFKRIGQKKPKDIVFNPPKDKLVGTKIFYCKEDRALIEEIEKEIKNQKNVRLNFRTKRVLDYFRHNYDMTLDKGKKAMEKYEYICKIFPRHEDFFEQDSKEELEKYMDVCKNVEDVNLGGEELMNGPHEKRTLETVIAKIIECGKPIVGHFPNLDIGLIYSAFIGDLPDSFEAFTDHINSLFPYIFDTKVISRRLQQKFKSIKVDLKSLYKACENKNTLLPYTNINYKYVEGYKHEDSSHEAGYDSFMTGCAFIGMLNCLYEINKEPIVFSKAFEENKLLYSRFAGEISLVGPVFTPKTRDHGGRIVVFGGLKKDHNWEQLGERLSRFGTLSVVEDHGETYYAFDLEQYMQQVLAAEETVKHYDSRVIVKGRRLFA